MTPERLEELRRDRRSRLSAAEYIEGVLAGDRMLLGRAITLIESTRPEDAELAQEILDACLPRSGRSLRVGITGAPGVGKSSVIETLGMHLIRERRENVAVLAIDPSSTISRGSILADKTRMSALANDEHAFVRPSPSGGSLGGVARRTREAMLLCEAAGYRNVIVETVGVGQSETAVRSMVDFFLLLILAGAGDELQGMKRGIVEMTDLIAVNKADGDNRPRAALARQQYESALRLFAPPATGWIPKVVTCSALTGEGIAGIWETVLEHHCWMRQAGQLEKQRRAQLLGWMREMIDETLREDFARNSAVASQLGDRERDVLEGRMSPFRAAQTLIETYRGGKPPAAGTN